MCSEGINFKGAQLKLNKNSLKVIPAKNFTFFYQTNFFLK